MNRRELLQALVAAGFVGGSLSRVRAQGSLTSDQFDQFGGWKAKTNMELIGKIKEMIEACPKLEMLKVRGHAGQAGNEEADYLATMAVRREDSTTRERPRRS